MLTIGRIRWIEGVLRDFVFSSRCKIEGPNISVYKLTEYVARLQLCAGLTATHKSNLSPVRRPSWLEFVKFPLCQLRIFPGSHIFAEDFADFANFAYVE